MKRIWYLTAAALLFAACGTNSAPEPDPVEELIPEPAAETAEASPEATAPSSHPLLHTSNTPEPSPSSDTHTQSESEVFVSESEQFSGAYSPSVTFFDDGTFVMHENLYEGMGDYSGTYSFDGAYYDCTVTDISFSGYKGDNIKQFSFLKFDADTLVLLDTLCGSQEKDVFARGTIKPEQEVGTVSTVRHYVSDSKMFSDPYMPELVLNPDGTFMLTENLFAGMGHYSGTFTSDDYILTLHVEETDFSGFAGDDVTEITFEALSEDVLQLMTDLCGSVKFDYWYRTVE